LDQEGEILANPVKTELAHHKIDLAKSSLEETYKAFLANKSKSTAIAYHHAVGEFLVYVGQHHGLKSVGNLSRNHIILFKNCLEENGHSGKTILKKLAAISSFTKFLAFEGHVQKDISYGITRPKSDNRRETADFSDSEVRLMLSSLNSNYKSYPLHYAILAVGFYTGLRSSEIRNLKIGDYGKIGGICVLRTIIKGDKQHTIPLNPIAIDSIEKLIEKKRELGHPLEPESYLFTSLKFTIANPLSASGLRQVFDRALTLSGINTKDSLERYSPHSMRASIAGHLLNTQDTPLEDVQRLLGHSSPTTTQRYNKRKKDLTKSPVYRINY
jgi:site-specific recombinase XerD